MASDHTTATPAATRTPTDYALEFAEYLARGAEHLIEAVCADAAVRLRIAESDDVDDDTEHDAQASVDEALRSLRNRIGEFRARRDRALSAPVAQGTYSLDADPDGIRARTADAIMGTLAFGAQGNNRPPEGHWLTPFWEAAQAEVAARSRLAPAAQEAEPAAGENPPDCNPELYAHGVSVGLFDIPKWAAERLCNGISAATGARVDWHYVGGRVHVKALPAPPAPRPQAPAAAVAPAESAADSIATAVCLQVAELPDRNSPEDWPEAMLVTADELRMIVREAIADAAAPTQEAEDAARYRYLRSRMEFQSQKGSNPTMGLAVRIVAQHHDPHADWMEPRFSASVDRAIDAARARQEAGA